MTPESATKILRVQIKQLAAAAAEVSFRALQERASCGARAKLGMYPLTAFDHIASGLAAPALEALQVLAERAGVSSSDAWIAGADVVDAVCQEGAPEL